MHVKFLPLLTDSISGDVVMKWEGPKHLISLAHFLIRRLQPKPISAFDEEDILTFISETAAQTMQWTKLEVIIPD